VNEDPKLFIEGRTQITAAEYAMREALVQFDARLGNISFFTSGQVKRKADTEGSKRKLVCKE
jgi:hypothetical protein